MALEPAILTYTKAEITAVSSRVYAITAPQGTARPYIVFSVISNVFSHAMGGDSGLMQTRVQFSVYGDTYASVKGVVEDLKAAYRNYIQGADLAASYMGADEDGEGGHWVQTTLLTNEIDFYEEDTGLYHTALDVFFWHREVD